MEPAHGPRIDASIGPAAPMELGLAFAGLDATVDIVT